MKRRLGTIALIISIVWIMYLGFVYNRTYFEHYPKVTVTVAERKPFIQDVSTVGYIEPAIRSMVRSNTSGKVVDIGVKVGEYVKSGTPLCQIESPELELQIQQAILNIERFRIEEERLKSEVYDIAQYEIALKREEENLRKAKEDLKKAEILFGNRGSLPFQSTTTIELITSRRNLPILWQRRIIKTVRYSTRLRKDLGRIILLF